MFTVLLPKTREELTETRESLQQMKEKLVGQEESFRKKCIDLEADVLSLRKANSELEVRSREGGGGEVRHNVQAGMGSDTVNGCHVALTSLRAVPIVPWLHFRPINQT